MILKRGLFNRRVFSQSLLALTVNVGGLLSGRLTVIFQPLFTAHTWILAIFPLVLTVRGGTSGILSGKLGTTLHTGEIKPQLRKNTQSFYSLLSSIYVLTFVNTVGMGFTCFGINLFLQQTALNNLIYYLITPILTCVLGVLFTIPITLFVAIKAFKSGLNPDILVYPTMSTINDIVVSVIYLIVVSLMIEGERHILVMKFFIILIAASSIILSIKYRHEEMFKQTLKEGTPIVLLCSIFGTLNGITLASFRGTIERQPSILILYPALMNILGSIGSIIGSLETTKLALGYFSSFYGVLKNAVSDILTVETTALMIHGFLIGTVYALGSFTNIPVDPIFIIKVALLSNIFSFLVVSLFSIIVATQTFKRGLDPDNFVIPLTSSISDTVLTLTLRTILVTLAVN
jgi:mgtE-like transporter